MPTLAQRLQDEFARRRTVQRYSRMLSDEFRLKYAWTKFREEEHPRDEMGKFTDAGTTTTAAKDLPPSASISTVNDVEDWNLYRKLVRDFSVNGWRGRPVLVVDTGDGYQALTGSHRIIAAQEAKVPIKALVISGPKAKEAAGLLFVGDEEKTAGLRRLGLTEAADIMSQENVKYRRRDRIHGGLGDTAKASDFDKTTLLRGLKVELEHTNDPAVALEIALDHLTEDSRYYEKLATLKLSRMLSEGFKRHRYAKFVESEHPRDEDGKFADGGKSGMTRIGKVGAKLLAKGREAHSFTRTVFHGSANRDLKNIAATQEGRAFDIALSELGAFFALDSKEAGKYAGPKGATYAVELTLKKPWMMPYELFEYLEDQATDGNGNPLDEDEEDGRMQELIGEAKAIRKQLQESGYDGIIIPDYDGSVREVVSFRDVAIPNAR